MLASSSHGYIYFGLKTSEIRRAEKMGYEPNASGFAVKPFGTLYIEASGFSGGLRLELARKHDKGVDLTCLIIPTEKCQDVIDAMTIGLKYLEGEL